MIDYRGNESANVKKYLAFFAKLNAASIKKGKKKKEKVKDGLTRSFFLWKRRRTNWLVVFLRKKGMPLNVNNVCIKACNKVSFDVINLA